MYKGELTKCSSLVSTILKHFRPRRFVGRKTTSSRGVYNHWRRIGISSQTFNIQLKVIAMLSRVSDKCHSFTLKGFLRMLSNHRFLTRFLVLTLLAIKCATTLRIISEKILRFLSIPLYSSLQDAKKYVTFSFKHVPFH